MRWLVTLFGATTLAVTATLSAFFLGLALVPGYVVGFLVAPPIARMLDRENSRFIVLVISTLSAIVLIARSF